MAALRSQLAALQAEHRQYVVKDEFARIYAENGGVGYNAFTSKDLTTYLVSLPANKLELWAPLESDRMQNAVLREFYTERDVVKEERRRSYESEPRRHALRKPGGQRLSPSTPTAIRSSAGCRTSPT